DANRPCPAGPFPLQAACLSTGFPIVLFDCLPGGGGRMQLRAAHVIHLAASYLALTATVSMAVAREFPYRGVINADDVYVRSGPGQDYYPTEKLKRGEVVEVYRHDPGGWYAVRPPA